ncbi:hypothetical protein AUJ68_05440 [Candidatus Woesearchaeota archaeon CG1_02_57_44]|nr:MAG: hypothetical protein AUJ68_05440 [Candidatus Woesearchaeota archaeon CG1_02_57_44]PIN67599.1 MAG: hypothetical protein COV94_07000 [Candidatus Woesearchaeota archaeon CG11_big_fil_rev_8_21_14_0_20_57_5]
MTLTQEQAAQVLGQIARHDRPTGTYNVPVSEHLQLPLRISNGVFGSDIMSSGILLARYLHANQNLFAGRRCLDMGCGPGTQGLLMAMLGAADVDLADINPLAVADAGYNARLSGLQDRVACYESDLFDTLPNTRYECIVFNHPFFPERPEAMGQDPKGLGASMLGGTDLINRFLVDAKDHLEPRGVIVMPYFHFAGPKNDPAAHAERFGYHVSKQERIDSAEGLQRGDFSIYEIKRGQRTSKVEGE